MGLDVLRAELERLFELEQLKQLSEELLGQDAPPDTGMAKAAFAGTLVQRCVETHAVEALCDVLVASREGTDPGIAELRSQGYAPAEELAQGEHLGDYLIERRLGEGGASYSYEASHDGARVRLKVLRSRATLDRSGVQRFFAVSRLLGRSGTAAVPKNVVAGPLGDRLGIAHAYVEGTPLVSRIDPSQPMQLREAWPLLRAVLEAFAEIHAQRIVHGSLKPQNVLMVAGGDGPDRALLIDAGAHFLYTATAGIRPGGVLACCAPKYASPEQIRGELPTARSDVYALGALIYEMLSGRPVFGGADLDMVVGHLKGAPEPLSFVTPHRWVGSELDEFVMDMLERDPARRPPDAEAVLDVLETVAGHSVRLSSSFPLREFDDRVAALLDRPASDEAAAVLEAAIEQGADAHKVAEAFQLAAEQVFEDDPQAKAAHRRLLTRAGALFESAGQDLEAAAHSYRMLLKAQPKDEVGRAALERVLRHQAKYEELVELLIEQTEIATAPKERARAFTKMGGLFATKLSDPEQALLAYTHAFCETPADAMLQQEIERLAGARADGWQDVLTACNEALGEKLPVERRNRLLAAMGHWYCAKVVRPDLGLKCFQEILTTDPANDVALAEMADIYRRAQQWREYGGVLVRRADAAVTPARGRDLRTEAANILVERLDDTESATRLLEQVLAEDATHVAAGEALARLYQEAEDVKAYVRVTEQRAASATGERRDQLLLQLAATYENQLDDLENATAKYHEILRTSSLNLDALRGLERIYIKTAQHDKLAENLEKQVNVAVTPHQKVLLLERVAHLHAKEFIDQDAAAETLERILDIDPDHPGAREYIPNLYAARERWSDLASHYERQARLHRGDERINALLALGQVCVERLEDMGRAIDTYETVLAMDPRNKDALRAIESLRSSTGDEDLALEASDMLAREASSPASQVMHYLRAAQLLEKRGDIDGVIDRCRRALEANPDDLDAAEVLRAAYVKRGEIEEVIGLLERDIARVEGRAAKARLCVELAELLNDYLEDPGRAAGAAERAIDYDPSNLRARVLLAELAYQTERYADAVPHYQKIMRRLDAFGRVEGAGILSRYLQALARTGSAEEALKVATEFLQKAKDDYALLQELATFFSQYASPQRAYELNSDVLQRFGHRIDVLQRAQLLCQMGEAAFRAGRPDDAVVPLEEAAALDENSTKPLRVLAELHKSQKSWEDAREAMERQLERTTGDDHVALHVEMGDLAAEVLGNTDAAARSYLAALGERPGERKVLLKLMQLYSEQRDWTQLVSVIINLAGFVDDATQKAKYLQTAARVSERELGDTERAVWLLDKALRADPLADDIVQQAIQLHQRLDDNEGAQRILEQQVQAASESMNRERALHYAEQLADLHLNELRVDDAISVYEAVQELNPAHIGLQEMLAELYATDPARYLDRAVVSQEKILAQDPYRPEPYRVLRQVYAGARRADAVWCVDQALTVMHRAAPEEITNFKRHRRPARGAITGRLTHEDWNQLVMHPQADPMLTSIFSLIQPSILSARSMTLADLGLSEEDEIRAAEHPRGMVRALVDAAEMLRMPLPRLFVDGESERAVSLPSTERRCLVLGPAALNPKVPPRQAAFVAASHLACLRTGLFVRYLVPTAVGLKAWMLAAIKLVAPRIPIAAELEGPAREAYRALMEHVSGQLLDRLAQPVFKLLNTGAQVDVSKWMQGVDFTTDRVGYLAADDLRTALEVLSASHQVDSEFDQAERTRELLRYSVSREYIELRDRLRIGVGWRAAKVDEVALDELLEGESEEAPQ